MLLNVSRPMRRVHAVVALLAGLVMSASVAAQGGAEYGEDTLRSYARAAIELRQIEVAAGERVSETTDAEKQAQVREQAQQAMVAAVRKHGLTVQEYNDIFQAVRADNELREVVMEYMSEAIEGES